MTVKYLDVSIDSRVQRLIWIESLREINRDKRSEGSSLVTRASSSLSFDSLLACSLALYFHLVDRCDVKQNGVENEQKISYLCNRQCAICELKVSSNVHNFRKFNRVYLRRYVSALISRGTGLQSVVFYCPWCPLSHLPTKYEGLVNIAFLVR